MQGSVSPLTNRFLSVIGIWMLGFESRWYSRLFLATGLLVLCQWLYVCSVIELKTEADSYDNNEYPLDLSSVIGMFIS